MGVEEETSLARRGHGCSLAQSAPAPAPAVSTSVRPANADTTSP